uniref:Uncharacterized protein n=1 Tax=Leersia perrieri TaxID=77586 RepID=A0A0D9XNP6_9ORYZ
MAAIKVLISVTIGGGGLVAIGNTSNTLSTFCRAGLGFERDQPGAAVIRCSAAGREEEAAKGKEARWGRWRQRVTRGGRKGWGNVVPWGAGWGRSV